MDIPDPLSGPKLKTILHKPGKDNGAGGKYTLSAHLWGYLQDYAEKHRLKGNGFGFGLFGPDDVARTLSARYYKDGSEILIRQNAQPPRRLTPRECARLMGFDSPSRRRMRIPVSDTQAYRQLGNAVVVPVVEAVARHMESFILNAVTGGRPEAPAKAVA
jgi:DNA (cytosine-5)-methyltransferase 1